MKKPSLSLEYKVFTKQVDKTSRKHVIFFGIYSKEQVNHGKTNWNLVFFSSRPILTDLQEHLWLLFWAL